MNQREISVLIVSYYAGGEGKSRKERSDKANCPSVASTPVRHLQRLIS